MIKRLWLLVGFFILSLIFPLSIQAQSEFSTSYTVDYTIRSNGTTHTRFDISLSNNLSNIYAKEFSLSIGSTQLENIKTYNQKGDLQPNISQGNSTTNIIIPFPEKVLGKDKTQDFSLEFDTLDFAHRLGSVWEISIPKLSKTDSLANYSLTLSVPNSFGQPATFSPRPINQSSRGGYTTYRFSQEDLFISGISAVFGRTQYFDFALNYHLQNPNIYQVKTEISLPPDTAFQKVILATLDPAPENITLDNDGNWLATYQLSPKETLNILATGSAQIHLQPQADFPRYQLSDFSPYLSAQQYWEVNNPRIDELARELTTPQNIYQYVVDNLIYDYGRLSDTTTRFGAANALDNQDSAICMEFTDLFVALSRAAGVPARAVNGFAYTTNSNLRPLSLKKDVLHAWPEYYDEKQSLWIPVDPTWGNTTGGVDFFHQTDLNHFSFTILGQNSTYPVPAGAYKLNSQSGKDVQIDFGYSATPQVKTRLSFNLPQKTIAGVPLTGQIILKNIGNTAVYNQTITLNSQNFKFNQNSWTVPALPPFASHIIDFELSAGGWNQSFTDTLTAVSDLSQAEHQLTLLPAYQLIVTHPRFKLALITIALLIVSFLSFKLYRKAK